MAYPHIESICCRFPNAVAMDVNDCMVMINKDAAGTTEPLIAISLINMQPSLANALRNAVELHGGV